MIAANPICRIKGPCITLAFQEEVHVNMKRRGAAGIHNDLAEWHQLGLEKRFSQLSMLEVDHESSIASFSSAEMEKKARFSTSDVDKHPIRNTSAKERQRRISVAVFQTLKAEGKKGVSHALSKNYLFTF